ncbi:killer cell lectin-like receptor subfamily E member 1 [Orycteropus afer afer]|uniref:Killer cell lectin-like receptor subfamily E member 1 n=1 Tax=Orycteropus afer afer TaxID=1230840 RepID=A0AC54Z6T1_ORYAF|nr:killer cell lectin-like receptor subfamily E member 1 [Orycteropus afer afer]
MKEEPIIHAALSLDSLPKYMQNNNIKQKSSSNELPLAKKELKHHRYYKKQHRNTAEDSNGKDFLLLPWKVVCGMLGVTCLLLLGTAIVISLLTENSSSKPTPLKIQQKGCQTCPKSWIWFKDNCYYFSKEELTWRESQRACFSHNSSLMKITREELNFFSLKSFFWIGVYHNGIDKYWLWGNDSVMASDILDLPGHQKEQVCLSYQSREAYITDNCESKQTYICKNSVI